jgi:PhoH-like ATPase
VYNGIKEITLSNEELEAFYKNNLKIDALPNQYVLIKSESGVVEDKYKQFNGKLTKLKYKTFESQILGKIKPRNIRQELYMDLLDSETPVKAVFGLAGSGKTMLGTAWALQEIQKGKYSKLIVVKNNISVQDVGELGALPGDLTDKLKVHCAFVADIVSDFMFDSLIQNNRLEIAYLGTMRGRSLTNSICLVSEAQNLTTNLIKMILSRIGEGSMLILDFDLDQIDRKNFERDNGMLSLTDSLQGNPLFGVVELLDVERSAVARLASLIK